MKTANTPQKNQSNYRHQRGMFSELQRAAALARHVGVVGVTATDEICSPPHLKVEGRKVINFASCDYMGAARHPSLEQGAISALRRWGVQFTSSPAYVKVDLYEELTALLAQIGDNENVAVAATTSLAHQGVLPVLVQSDDLVVVDVQAHASLGQTMNILRGLGVNVRTLAHSRMDHLEKMLQRRADTRVWYVADGVYSMYGDVAPLERLAELSARYENLWLYFDDAHGFGWTGEHGRGVVLSRFAGHARTVVAVSLCKAFAAGGAAVYFPSPKERDACQLAGVPFVVSGPLKPSELGAGVAAARGLLSGEFDEDRARLRHNIWFTESQCQQLELELEAPDCHTPVFYVRIGDTDDAIGVARRLLDEGFLVNPTGYPIVPRDRSGIRIAVTAKHEPAQIEALLEALKDATRDHERDSGMHLIDETTRVFASSAPPKSGIQSIPGGGT